MLQRKNHYKKVINPISESRDTACGISLIHEEDQPAFEYDSEDDHDGKAVHKKINAEQSDLLDFFKTCYQDYKNCIYVLIEKIATDKTLSAINKSFVIHLIINFCKDDNLSLFDLLKYPTAIQDRGLKANDMEDVSEVQQQLALAITFVETCILRRIELIATYSYSEALNLIHEIPSTSSAYVDAQQLKSSILSNYLEDKSNFLDCNGLIDFRELLTVSMHMLDAENAALAAMIARYKPNTPRQSYIHDLMKDCLSFIGEISKFEVISKDNVKIKDYLNSCFMQGYESDELRYLLIYVVRRQSVESLLEQVVNAINQLEKNIYDPCWRKVGICLFNQLPLHLDMLLKRIADLKSATDLREVGELMNIITEQLANNTNLTPSLVRFNQEFLGNLQKITWSLENAISQKTI